MVGAKGWRHPTRLGKRLHVNANKFTLDVMTDDKRVEKDKNLNEPVPFYTGSRSQRLRR